MFPTIEYIALLDLYGAGQFSTMDNERTSYRTNAILATERTCYFGLYRTITRQNLTQDVNSTRQGYDKHQG